MRLSKPLRKLLCGVREEWRALAFLLCTPSHLEACVIINPFTDREIEAERGFKKLNWVLRLVSGRGRI